MDQSIGAIRPHAAVVFAATLCVGLAACGGGGSGSGSTGTQSSVSGTVATGSPVAGTTVTAYEPNGTSCGTATTAADGTYTLKGTCSLPYLLAANTSGGVLLTPITSTQSGGSITPITTGILSGATGTPSTASIATLAATLSTLSNSQLTSVGAQVLAQLANLFPSYTGWSGLNPFASFSANHSGVDAVLDQLALEVSGSSVTFMNTNTGEQFTTTYSGGSATVGSIVPVPNLTSSTPASWPATVQYVDYNYTTTALANPPAPGTATISDNGPSAGTGTLTTTSASGVSVAPLIGVMTVNGSLTAGIGFDTNASDYNAPSVAMACGAAVSGNGTNGNKSWDVLLPANATLVTSASQAAGLSFTRYYEDCTQGGTYPATTTGNYLNFDGSGNASFVVSNNGTASSVSVPASQFFAGPVTNPGGSASGATVQWSLYQYTTAAGLVRYAVVEHGSSSATAASAGTTGSYIGLWLQ